MMTGGHSAIGEFIDGMFGVGSTATVVDYLKQAWENVVTVVKAVWPALQFLGQQTALFLKDMFHGFEGYGTMFEEFFHFVWEDIKKLFDDALNYLMSKIPGLKIVLSGLADGYKAIFGNTEDEANPALAARRAAALQAAAAPPSATAALPMAPGSVGGNVSQSNDIQINVNGAGDPSAVAARTASVLGTTNQQNQNALGAMARP